MVDSNDLIYQQVQRAVLSTLNRGFIIVLSFLSLFSLPVFGQDNKPEDKIDPAFRVLISQQKQNSKAPRKTASCGLLKTTKVDNTKKPSPGETYECIIYTKNAKALRDKNIIINSELPNFVTALVTLHQMEQMSLMPEVTYIEHPKTDRQH